MVREYIGARYVPRFMGTWSNTTQYEALDIVDDGLGTSYTSKIPVPAGTPLTNTTYWAVTGSTNGAIVSLQNRVSALEDIFTTPQFFGAEADGVTDDTQAIQDAVDSGMNVYFPSGNYLVKNHVVIPSDIILFGSGTIVDDLSGLADNDDGAFYINNKKNIIIEGLRFQGAGALSGTPNHGCLIFANNSENITIRDCEFFDVDKYYSVCTKATNNVLVDGIYVHDYSYSGYMNLNAGCDITVSNSRFIDCVGKSAFHSYPISVSGHDFVISSRISDAKNLKVIGNYIENSGDPWWEGIDAHGGINVVISDNIVKNTYSGIAIFGEDNGYFILEDAVISNNVLIGPGTTGSVENFGNAGIVVSRADRVNIENNLLTGWGGLSSSETRAIRLGICNDVSVSGNTINNNGPSSDSPGDVIYIAGNRISVYNNNIYSNKMYYAFGITGDCHDIDISTNLIRNSGHLSHASLTGASPMRIRVHDNNTDDAIGQNTAQGYVPQVAAGSNVLKGGMLGDIVYNSAPASGSPLGWICTTAETGSGLDAVWTNLPNI